MNETITINCRKLKRKGIIHSCYSINGITSILWKQLYVQPADLNYVGALPVPQGTFI